MTKDIIKRAENGTYYFRANLGYNPETGKQIQKYKSEFKTKRRQRTPPRWHRATTGAGPITYMLSFSLQVLPLPCPYDL